MNANYIFFWSGIYSNWHPSNFVYNDILFKNTEMWMMYCKARLFEPEMCEHILNAKSPKEVKALGRKIRNFNEQVWCNIREDVMYAGYI